MTDFTSKEQPKPKKSSVRHTRAKERDRTKRPITAAPDEAIVQRLTSLVYPATLAQVDDYHQLGLRERVLTLPVMVALVLSLISIMFRQAQHESIRRIWRQMSGVCEFDKLNPAEFVRLVRTELLITHQSVHLTGKSANLQSCKCVSGR